MTFIYKHKTQCVFSTIDQTKDNLHAQMCNADEKNETPENDDRKMGEY